MIIENIDRTIKHIGTNEEFLVYIQSIWDENEIDDEANMERPFDVYTSIIYLIMYTELNIVSIQ